MRSYCLEQHLYIAIQCISCQLIAISHIETGLKKDLPSPYWRQRYMQISQGQYAGKMPTKILLHRLAQSFDKLSIGWIQRLNTAVKARVEQWIVDGGVGRSGWKSEVDMVPSVLFPEISEMVALCIERFESMRGITSPMKDHILFTGKFNRNDDLLKRYLTWIEAQPNVNDYCAVVLDIDGNLH
eukprot:123352_1